MPEALEERRREELRWFRRYRWFRKLTPALLVVGGFCWSEAYAFYLRTPTPDRLKRYDETADAAGKLALQVVAMQGEVSSLRSSINRQERLSSEQRREIMTKLEKLEDQLRSWFARAAK